MTGSGLRWSGAGRCGGQPFPDGEEPDSHRHGDADDAFASVVFDEEFVRSAAIHEPTAVERMLAAAQARAEAEATRSRAGGGPADDDPYDYDDPYEDAYGGAATGHHPGRAGQWPTLTHDLDPDDAYGPYGRYGAPAGPTAAAPLAAPGGLGAGRPHGHRGGGARLRRRLPQRLLRKSARHRSPARDHRGGRPGGGPAGRAAVGIGRFGAPVASAAPRR
ncbi:hypothetical protein ACFQ2B_21530 [Streptomyces stramineus]